MPKNPEVVSGWLVNEARRQRRDNPNTLLDSHVESLIQSVLTMPEYSKEEESTDRLLRLRDAGLHALAWTWFKRGGEDLGVKVGQVSKAGRHLSVMFRIEKKSKSWRICPFCDIKGKPVKNAKAANFCRNCGKDISKVELTVTHPNPEDKIKNRSLDWPFAKHILTWLETARGMGARPEDYLFPPFISREQKFDWTSHLTVQRFDQILQRVDPTLTSSFFRYGHTEKLYRLGYSTGKVRKVGDWESEKMPETYAKRKGITAEETEFADDSRML